jgi:hypothetical protein
MTNDSDAFFEGSSLLEMDSRPTSKGSWVTYNGEEYLPLFEGRMVHQFDAAAKGYRSGQGRTARWDPLPWTEKRIAPHYFVAEAYATKVRNNYFLPRAGYCDVTGHANERTVLAALVSGHSVCGNKVSTCQFDVDEQTVQISVVGRNEDVDGVLRTHHFGHGEVTPPAFDPEIVANTNPMGVYVGCRSFTVTRVGGIPRLIHHLHPDGVGHGFRPVGSDLQADLRRGPYPLFSVDPEIGYAVTVTYAGGTGVLAKRRGSPELTIKAVSSLCANERRR